MSPVDVPKVNIPRVRTKIARGLRIWAARAKLKGLPYEEKSLANATSEVGKVTIAYKIPTSWEFLKITRSLLTLDASLKYLYPGMNSQEIIRNYFKEAESRELSRNLDPIRIIALLRQISDGINEYNFLILPQLRQRTLAFGGLKAVNKFALLLAFILRTLSSVGLIGGFSLFYAFLFQHHLEIIKPIHAPLINKFLRQLPSLSYLEWFLIFIFVGLSLKTLLACSVILERDEFPQRIQ